MFGRKKDGDGPPQPAESAPRDPDVEELLKGSAARRTTPLPARAPAGKGPAADDMIRRPAAQPASRPAPTAPALAPAPANPAPTPAPQTEDRKLVVGRDIQLRGEVTSCDSLIVEGSVDLSLSDARQIQVAASGLFTGTADVAEADIAGRFDGNLTARERLIVRSTGVVSGHTRYANIVIEAGGQISGEIGHLGPKAASSPSAETPEPAPAAKPARFEIPKAPARVEQTADES